LRGAGVIFFAYVGFDAASTVAQEAKNPKRDVPIGILGSLGISTILYILMAIVLTGMVSYTRLNVADPVAVGVNSMGDKMFWLRPIIKIARRIKFSNPGNPAGTGKDISFHVK
jgi:APA family basic amino acid/polyamine antiporter